jgi:hypothetical protein
MRLALLGILIASAMVASAQDCTDYGLYPHVIGESDQQHWNVAIAVSATFAAVAVEYSDAIVLDITEPRYLPTAGTFGCRARHIVLTSGYAYLLTTDRTIQAYDMAEPAAPALTSEVDTGLILFEACVVGPYLYALGSPSESELPSRLLIFDVSNPGQFQQVGEIEMPNRGRDFSIADGRLHYLGIDNVLTTFDLSDPLQPQFVNDTAMDTHVTQLAVAGRHAFVGGNELLIVDLQLPSGPAIVGRVPTDSSINGIVVRDDIAYLAVWSSGLTMVDVGDPAEPAVIAATNLGGNLHDVVLAGDVAYVAGHGVSAIDVGLPQAPPALDTLPLQARATNIVVRDDLAYLTDQSSTLSVIDMSDPTQLVALGSAAAQGFPGDLAMSGGIAVVASGSGVELFDVSDPTAPALVGDLVGYGRSSARIAIVDDIVYEVLFYQGTGFTSHELLVIDIGVPAFPVVLTSLPLPDGTKTITTRGSVAYIGGAAGEVHLYDISVPSQPQLIESQAIPGAFDQVVGSGNFIVSGHENGIDIYDLTDPLHPQHVAGLPSLDLVRGVALHGSTVYVGELLDGLTVIDIADPASPFIVGRTNVPYNTDDVALFGDLILVAGTEGVQVLLPHCEGTVAIEPNDGDPHGDSPPAGSASLAAYPNPFNPMTTISFTNPHDGRVRLEIIDLRGRLVGTLVDGFASAGRHEVTWNGRTDGGQTVASGVYLARLETAGRVVHERMTLVR